MTAAHRAPFDPDLPTVAELGFPDYAATNWYAFVAASKTPQEAAAHFKCECAVWKKIIADSGLWLE